MGMFERVFIATFGVFLFLLGLYVVFFGVVAPVWRIVAGIVLAALGVNAVYGAIVGKRPWISEIGSLP